MQTTIIYIELTFLIIAALVSDIKTYKIKNEIVFAFIAIGFTTSLISGGLSAFPRYALATVLPIPLLMILFALRMLGAGDIKLFCAIGAITGVPFVLYCMAYSFISGGVLALTIMLVNKSFRKRGRFLLEYIKTCFLTKTLQPYSDFTNKTDGATFRFSYAIACGTIITLIEQGTVLCFSF